MAKQQGETKTPLVIALSVFVLLTLILGVMLYLAYDEKAAAKANEKKAGDEKGEIEKKYQAEKDKVLMYRVAVGMDSQDDFDSLKNTSKKPEVYEEYKKFTGELRGRLQGLVAAESRAIPGSKFEVKESEVLNWPWADGQNLENRPEKGLFAVVVNAYAKQLLASQKQTTAEKNSALAAENYQKLSKEYADAVQILRTVAQTFPAQTTAKVEEVKQQVASEIKKFEKATDTYNKYTRDKTDAVEAANIAIAQQQQQIQGLNTRVGKAEDKLNAREDQFAYEKSHGKITKRTDNIVYIDLGDADKVRPGLTFTVQPSDTPERGIDSRKIERTLATGEKEFSIKTKGMLEVISVLGPHLSQARITAENDPIRERILNGDVLYNAAWRKGAADHVALFGVFDVDADGSDDIKMVVRDLTRMGIIVDAVYDIEKKAWQGKITSLTTYAIEGYYPSSSNADALAAVKSAIDQNLRDAKKVALENGVKVVKARDFFPRIGYQIRLDITPDTINRAYNKYLQTAPLEVPAPVNN